MAKKPYIYESLEGWLQITRKKSWYDPSVNPGDLAPYSEFQRPYINDRDMSYPEWEWSWPTSTWPPIDDISWPDPIDNPCSIDEDCVWAGIIGPEEMECDQCFTWSQAHLWLGCGDAPWWAAFGLWRIVEKQFITGDCDFLFQGPVMATVCCDEDAQGRFNLRYEGALDCVGEVEVSVTCQVCCEEMSLTGASTVAPGNTWTGTISPACDCATCTVVSNSGCTLSCNVNEAGNQVTVATAGSDCGGFTVTVTDENCAGDCPVNTDSKFVRITGGSWELDDSSSGLGLAGCDTCSCGGGISYYATTCEVGEYMFGGLDAVNDDCTGTGSAQCKGDPATPCDPCGEAWGYDPCGWGGTCPAERDDCRRYSWWRCKWVCVC
jgi:hypothetical protein